MKIYLFPLFAFLLLQEQGCENDTTDHKQAIATNAVAAQADQQVGMPGVTQFTEKRIVRRLYELRDKNVATFTYIPDLQGRLWHLCDSIGYGLPYGVQFTNPERMNWVTAQGPNLPQPEPNGLFMPPSAEGTWIICAGGGGNFQPVYVEPRTIVSPFRLNSFGEYQIAAPAEAPAKKGN